MAHKKAETRLGQIRQRRNMEMLTTDLQLETERFDKLHARLDPEDKDNPDNRFLFLRPPAGTPFRNRTWKTRLKQYKRHLKYKSRLIKAMEDRKKELVEMKAEAERKKKEAEELKALKEGELAVSEATTEEKKDLGLDT